MSEMKESHRVRRKLKILKAQTVMRDVESTIFAANCTWKYGTPVTSKTRNQNTATKCQSLVQNAKIRSIFTKHFVMFWNKNEGQNVVTRLADFWKNSVQVFVKLQCMQKTEFMTWKFLKFSPKYYLLYLLLTRSDTKQIF